MRRLKNYLIQLICLAALLLALPASAATSEAASLGSYLNPDGTMNLPKDFVGSLNPAGFRMVQEKGVSHNLVTNALGNSDNGRFVMFETDASNLVGLDNNGRTEVLVKAFDTRETIRLSRTIDGVQPNGASEQPSISGGSTILFISSATNLTPNDNNQAADAFSVEIATPEIDAATAVNLTGHWAKASENGWGLTAPSHRALSRNV